MKHTLRTFARSLALSAAFLSAPAIADDHAAAEDVAKTEATETLSGEPALWKVADDDTTIYLFGTIHALPKDVSWMDEDISAALSSSDTLVTEVDMTEMAGPKMVELIQTTAVLPEGTTLRSLLDEEQAKVYEAALQQIQVPAAAFDRFEPWYASMMMSMLPLLQQGYSPETGVENALLKIAGDIDKGALETVEFQLGMFDELPQETQIEFLISTAEHVGEVKTLVDAMVAEWLEADADGLATLMNENMDDEMIAERLLYFRNRNWAEWIDTRMDAPGTVFMAVGAGHLAGENSVQDYLEERGMTVTRVQ